MASLEGKVAFITGGGRGQGRSHAVRLAAEGADIILVDICHDIEHNAYELSTPEDLAETVRLVEEQDRRALAAPADVRDYGALKDFVDQAVAELGRLDIVLANAGICPMSEDTDAAAMVATFQAVVDVNLVGVFNTCSVAAPHIVAGGRGGSIVITSSTAGLKGGSGGSAGSLGYTAAKHGVVGIMRALANQLAPHSIRVNTIHPTGVNTKMVVNPMMQEWMAKIAGGGTSLSNALPVQMLEPADVSATIAFLVSDEARYITGVTLPVDAGYTNR